MKKVFETERLYFREFVPGDSPLIFELNSDPEVVKYLHEPLTKQDDCEEIIANVILPQYRLYNHGRWAVHLKTTGEFMGWCGLKFRTERNEVDLGYRFMKQYWGAGFATEAAAETVYYGFRNLKLDRIFGAAHIDNIASQIVLEKTGFNFIGLETIDGCPAKTYELFAPIEK